MTVVNPTTTYKWQLPIVGANIGSYGGLLNTIFSNELTDEELLTHGVTPISPPPGIDQIIHLLQVELDASEADVTGIGTRVGTLENAPPALLAARMKQTVGQSIPKDSNTSLVWDSIVFDQGGLMTANASKITIPLGGQGLWQFRASVKMNHLAGGSGDDDGRFIELSIVKNNGELLIGFARVPITENGASAASLDISVEASATDVATDGDVYEAMIKHGTAGGSQALTADEGTFFEGVRITREVP